MKQMLYLVGLCLLVASCSGWWMPRQKKKASAEIDEGCIQLARTGDCDMYDCMKERHPCEIFTRAAKPVCVGMKSKKNRFDHMGKEWLNWTQSCLQDRLIEAYRAEEYNCDDLKDAIKANSSQCALLVHPNICDIFKANTAVLVESENAELSDSRGVLGQCGWTVLTSYMSYMASRS